MSIHRAATHSCRRPGGSSSLLVLATIPARQAQQPSRPPPHTLSPLLPSLSLDHIRPHPRHQGKPAHARCPRRTRTRLPAPPHPHRSHRRRRLIRLCRIPRPSPNAARVGVLPAAGAGLPAAAANGLLLVVATPPVRLCGTHSRRGGPSPAPWRRGGPYRPLAASVSFPRGCVLNACRGCTLPFSSRVSIRRRAPLPTASATVSLPFVVRPQPGTAGAAAPLLLRLPPSPLLLRQTRSATKKSRRREPGAGAAPSFPCASHTGVDPPLFSGRRGRPGSSAPATSPGYPATGPDPRPRNLLSAQICVVNLMAASSPSPEWTDRGCPTSFSPASAASP